MNICIVGIGYVGLVAAACFAKLGNSVICVDKDFEKLENLKKSIIPFYEPDLEELIKENIKNSNLIFSNDIKFAIKNSSIIFIAVGTPSKEDGQVDLNDVFDVVEKIAPSIDDYKIIVEKSTVPVGTSDKIAEIISKHTNNFDIVSNPEFLKQGSAINDFLHPDRIIIGSNSEKATNLMKKLYSNINSQIIEMDIKSAEMTKYAANSFLALKVSFANEIANICEKIGADFKMVKQGIATDNRIGDKFLQAGLGWGGSCFPKDVKALLKIADEKNYNAQIINAAQNVNNNQKKLFIEKIKKYFNNNLKNKTFAIWGLSFKPDTDDLREAPSIIIVNELLNLGAKIQAYDPKAINNAKKIIKNITFSNSKFEALKDADALLILTEWLEFKEADFNIIKNTLKKPIIFDGRNIYDNEKLKKTGFEYFQIGKN